jgi:hypothetical protein
VFTDGGNLSVEYLRGLGDRLAGPIFLAGHAGPGLALFLEGRADLITLLRRPVDQAVSNYLHVLSDPQNALHADALRGSFSDYLRGHDDQIDYQARSLCVVLSDDPRRMDAIRLHRLEILLQFIDSLPFVGVMERAQSCGEALSRLMRGPGAIDLPCLNAAVYRGVSVRTLERLRREYEALSRAPELAPIFAREALVHARAVAALDRVAPLTAGGPRRPVGASAADFIGARRFSTLDGRFTGAAIVADLAGEPAHIAYGPYDLRPRGPYAAEFHFTVEGASAAAAGRIEIEALANGRIGLRRRWLRPQAWTSPRLRTLHFQNTRATNVLEFRMRGKGFAAGALRFEGVSLSPSSAWRAWPSLFARLAGRVRRGLRSAARRLQPRHG